MSNLRSPCPWAAAAMAALILAIASGAAAQPGPIPPFEEVRIRFAGRGAYDIVAGTSTTPTQPTGAGSEAVLGFPAPPTWRVLRTIRIYRPEGRGGGRILVGTLTLARHGFQATAQNRRISLPELSPGRCDLAGPSPGTGEEETRLIRAAVHWHGQAERCRRQDMRSAAYLAALNEALRAEIALVDFDPTRYAVTLNLRQEAAAARDASALCATPSKSPVCGALAGQLRRAAFLDAGLYWSISEIQPRSRDSRLTDREITDALEALRAAETANTRCLSDKKGEPICEFIDFAGVRAAFCAVAESRDLPARPGLCKPPPPSVPAPAAKDGLVTPGELPTP